MSRCSSRETGRRHGGPDYASGQFELGGFQGGEVFLFRGDGFRFHGQMLEPGDHDINVELTRSGERPRRESRSSRTQFRSRNRGHGPTDHGALVAGGGRET